MSRSTQAPQIEERQAIAQLAQRFDNLIVDGTPRKHVYAAALALICTYAEFAAERDLVAALLHAAADEMTNNGGRFGQTAH